MSQLHKAQQKRIDDIVKKYHDYMDMFYDDKEPEKKSEKERRKPSQDIGLEPQEPKKPDYGTGICIHPGCFVEFKKNSGVQLHCPAHRRGYVPVAKRGSKDGSKS